MPIYEYSCLSCGGETEVMQKMSDPPATDCPACGKATLAKQVSAAGFRLSGGGWYETDFKSANKKNVAADKAPEKAPEKTKESSACAPGGCDKPACAAKPA